MYLNSRPVVERRGGRASACGATEATYTTQGEALAFEHANSCIAFNGHGSLLVSNHAFATMIPSNFNVLDVYVNDKGDPLEKPDLP